VYSQHPPGRSPLHLFLVLVDVFDLGVVYWEVPAVGGVPHAVAAGAQQGGLPLGGHGLQRGEHRVPSSAAAAQTLAHTQVQRPVLIDVLTRALESGMKERREFLIIAVKFIF